MSKIAIITDIHFGVKKNSEIFLESQMKFIREEFIPYLLKNNISHIFFLGDLYDNRNSINTKIMTDVFELFSNDLKQFDIHMVVGNHDCYFNTNTLINSLKFFHEFDNVTLIEKITQVNIDGRDIVLVPWITDEEEFKKEIINYKSEVCMGHFEIAGFSYNPNSVSLHGISDEIFSNYNLVFSGHFHMRASRKIGDTNFIYVGSPYQITRADMEQDRGFAVLDTDTLQYEFINNTMSMKYIKVKYPDEVKEEDIKGNHVDVYVDYNDHNEKFDSYIKKIEQMNPIEPPVIFINNEELSKVDFDISESNIGNVLDLMKEYIDILNIDKKEVILDKLVTLYNETKADLK